MKSTPAYFRLALLCVVLACGSCSIAAHGQVGQAPPPPPALTNVPYVYSHAFTCTAPCTYTNSAATLPDGRPLKVDPNTGVIAFTSSKPTTKAITTVITATGLDGETDSISVSFTILDGLVADPSTASASTGTQQRPMLLPSLASGSLYRTSIGVSGSAGCHLGEGAPPPPLGLFQYNAAAGRGNSNFAVDARGIEAGEYVVALVCSDGTAETGYFEVTVSPSTTAGKSGKYDSPCKYEFNDCDWVYDAYGGVEQSALSAQDSKTNAFIDLFVRAPWNQRTGSVWLRSRFLGAPTNSDTFNVTSAISDPTGTLKASAISEVGTAVDYTIGYEYDFFQPSETRPGSGMFTLGVIGGFGATTPTSSQSAAVAYAMPDFGSQECSELQARFGTQNQAGLLPAQELPAGGTYTNSGTAPPTATSYCSLQTKDANGNALATPIPINDIAFVPEDRTSFLLKWGGGVRLVNRWHSGTSNHCSSRAATDTNPGDSTGDPNTVNGVCYRSIVDFTFGQDEAITGGSLHRYVVKGDAILPILQTGIYFFGSADIRTMRDTSFAPLLLTPVPIAATGTTAAGSVTIPSSNIWLLPLKQPNRDFYRFGLSVDLSGVFVKLFGTH
jgi:hypothetical protein